MSRDPDAIAAEIEQTRAELADTIDAIADRISPKNVASRGAQAVKTQVATAKSKITGDSSEPAPTDAASAPLADGGPSANSSLPVVPIAGLAAVLVLILLFIRKRRSR
jgi:hypothetical protein